MADANYEFIRRAAQIQGARRAAAAVRRTAATAVRRGIAAKNESKDGDRSKQVKGRARNSD